MSKISIFFSSIQPHVKNLIAATDFPTYKHWVLANISTDTECDIVGINALRILLQVR